MFFFGVIFLVDEGMCFCLTQSQGAQKRWCFPLIEWTRDSGLN